MARSESAVDDFGAYLLSLLGFDDADRVVHILWESRLWKAPYRQLFGCVSVELVALRLEAG
jgi:hypothetical protein